MWWIVVYAKANGLDKTADECGKQVGIMTWHDREVRDRLKKISAETGKTQNRLLAEALNLMFREYHKPEIALE